MKIIYACWLDNATTDFPLFLTQCWERRGHVVHLFPFDLEFANLAGASVFDLIASRDVFLRQQILHRRLSRICRQIRPDALLFAYPFIAPRAMRQLREAHGMRIGFSLGYNNLLDYQIAESISVSDFVLVHDTYLVPIVMGRRNGRCPRVFTFSAAANPEEHTPFTLSKWDQARYGGDIAFIGGYSEDRAVALVPLSRFALRIWGYPVWDKAPELAPFWSAEPVYGLKKTKIYNACKIVVNYEDPEKNINSINSRVPEVLACGGFVLSQWSMALEACGFRDGETVASFKDCRELADKAEYYLAHPEERRRVSEKGRAHVLKNMSYDASYGRILDDVEASLGLRKAP